MLGFEAFRKYELDACKAVKRDLQEPRANSCTGALRLGKRIGTPSLDSTVRLATTSSGLVVACKVQEAKAWAVREVKLLESLTPKAFRGQIHLPMVFGSVRCGDQIALFTELMDGDLKQWFMDASAKRSPGTYGSAVAQVVLGFGQLHAEGIAHCDSHWGQVLFKRLRPGGVWHYRVGGRDVYVRNAGFLFKVWDLGQSGPLGKCTEYKNESENVYYALGPFLDPKQLGAVLRADPKSASVASHLGKLSRELGVGAHKLAPLAYDLLVSLPGVWGAKPRNMSVLNATPMTVA